MLKKIFISAILLIAVLSFVVSLLSGKNNDEKVIAAPADRVAVINIEGTIVSGEPGENIWGETTGASSGRLMREIREAAADSSVKALVLRINSPGGSVTAAEEVGRELKRFKELLINRSLLRWATVLLRQLIGWLLTAIPFMPIRLL